MRDSLARAKGNNTKAELMEEEDRRSEHVDDKTGSTKWSVWRQDDNGNIALVKGGLTEKEALHLVAEYEAKGHKQTYWAQEAK